MYPSDSLKLRTLFCIERIKECAEHIEGNDGPAQDGDSSAESGLNIPCLNSAPQIFSSPVGYERIEVTKTHGIYQKSKGMCRDSGKNPTPCTGCIIKSAGRFTIATPISSCFLLIAGIQKTSKRQTSER